MALTSITSTPSEAQIYVNGVKGWTTPHMFAPYKAGDKIRIEKSGYTTINYTLTSSDIGKTKNFTLTSTAAPAPAPAKKYGDVRIQSSPSNARIFIGGSSTGKTTPATLTLETGTRIIKLMKDGYTDYSWIETIKEESRLLSLKFLTQVPLPTPAPKPTPAPAPVKTTLDYLKESWTKVTGGDWLGAMSSFINSLSAPVSAGLEKQAEGADVVAELFFAAIPVGKAGKMIEGLESAGKLTAAQAAKMTAKAGSKGFIEFFKSSWGDAVKLFSKLEIAEQSKMVDELVKTGDGINTLNGLMKAKALNPAVVRPAEQAIDASVKSMMKGFSLADIKKTLPWLGGAVAVMGSANFVEFLYEEMLQTQGMGIYVAIANKQWDVAKKTLDTARGNLEKATWIYTNLGWLAPYAWDVFKTYASATKLQYDSYEAIINKQLGITTDPSAGGKVFNVTDFQKNLSAGNAPNIDKLIASQITEKPAAIKVRSITDGDTILTLLPDTGIEQSVRLLGIDAPEKGKTGYKESLAWLNSQLLGADVTLQIDPAQAKDKYDRVLAIVMKGSENINLKSLRNGWSIFYPYAGNIYVDAARFKEAETTAKNENLGIWALIAGAKIPPTPTEEVSPVVKPAAELIKITKEEFFDAMKGFYVGRMYLSKKELAALVKQYDVTDIQDFIDEIYTFYVGRMYLSKKELKTLGAKYGFDVSGL